MFKWFVNNLKIIGMGFIVLLSAILFPPLTYFIGAAILGYVCWRLYCMGYDNGGAIMQTEQNSQLQDNGWHMVSDKMLKKYMDKDLNERRIVEKRSAPNDETSFNFSRGLNDFFCGFFTLSFKQTKSNQPVNPLTNAALQCKEQTDLQNIEVRIITRALTDLNLEARFLVAQELKQQAILRAGISHNGLDNELPTQIESRSGAQRKQLFDELSDLMNSYPESSFEKNPCLEAIESYAKERKAHHEKIMAVAEVLLPNLSGLLKEAKIASNLQINPPMK